MLCNRKCEYRKKERVRESEKSFTLLSLETFVRKTEIILFCPFYNYIIFVVRPDMPVGEMFFFVC